MLEGRACNAPINSDDRQMMMVMSEEEDERGGRRKHMFIISPRVNHFHNNKQIDRLHTATVNEE